MTPAVLTDGRPLRTAHRRGLQRRREATRRARTKVEAWLGTIRRHSQFTGCPRLANERPCPPLGPTSPQRGPTRRLSGRRTRSRTSGARPLAAPPAPRRCSPTQRRQTWGPRRRRRPGPQRPAPPRPGPPRRYRGPRARRPDQVQPRARRRLARPARPRYCPRRHRGGSPRRRRWHRPGRQARSRGPRRRAPASRRERGPCAGLQHKPGRRRCEAAKGGAPHRKTEENRGPRTLVRETTCAGAFGDKIRVPHHYLHSFFLVFLLPLLSFPFLFSSSSSSTHLTPLSPILHFHLPPSPFQVILLPLPPCTCPRRARGRPLHRPGQPPRSATRGP